MSRADRLLRAAVSGYCALTRQRRFDAQQLQDLAMPLVGSASRDTLRYVAAALSKCETEPPELVRELAGMSIDIAAPLLSRARTLTDADLINLIAAHGLGHAQAIARRQNLHPSIAQLIRNIELRRPATQRLQPAEPPAPPELSSAERLERAREKLRAIMLAARTRPTATQEDIRRAYERLRDTALSGGGAPFVAALAGSLGIDRATAWIIASDGSSAKFVLAARAIGLTEEQAYLIASALFPLRFPNAESIVSFLECFRELSLDDAGRQLDAWQAGAALRPARSG
ncbi:MAG: DUF2336 domain-containing protein [Rhizobiaceae bacterium]|nr:DUF2336 domain-containing protein [Rhizobiaceae bacterium]